MYYTILSFIWDIAFSPIFLFSYLKTWIGLFNEGEHTFWNSKKVFSFSSVCPFMPGLPPSRPHPTS